MEKYNRQKLNDRYFQIVISECPKEIILLAAEFGSENVTVENFSNYGRKRADFEFEIKTQGLSLKPRLKRFDVDFSITKAEFIRFIDIWDEQGCYAIFHNAGSPGFRATDLPEMQRYRALDNFGWTVEIAVPGSASDGMAQISSPNEKVIDVIEQQLIKSGLH